MNFLNPLLEVNKTNRSTFSIICWWEIRRILYNIIVLISGIVSMGIMIALINLKPSEDLVEPIVIIGFAFLCNLGYTLDWVTEVNLNQTLNYGPKMFKVGIRFTLFWVFLPAILHIIFWIFRGFEKMN